MWLGGLYTCIQGIDPEFDPGHTQVSSLPFLWPVSVEHLTVYVSVFHVWLLDYTHIELLCEREKGLLDETYAHVCIYMYTYITLGGTHTSTKYYYTVWSLRIVICG